MKPTSSKLAREGLRTEYQFDYSKSKPNRFAAKLKGTTAVVLQPDVAKVFHSAEAVNDLLRSAIAATGAAHSSKAASTHAACSFCGGSRGVHSVNPFRPSKRYAQFVVYGKWGTDEALLYRPRLRAIRVARLLVKWASRRMAAECCQLRAKR